jgi:hypothetical protein
MRFNAKDAARSGNPGGFQMGTILLLEKIHQLGETH